MYSMSCKKVFCEKTREFNERIIKREDDNFHPICIPDYSEDKKSLEGKDANTKSI